MHKDVPLNDMLYLDMSHLLLEHRERLEPCSRVERAGCRRLSSTHDSVVTPSSPLTSPLRDERACVADAGG